MTNTFIAVQISPKETITYEIPNVLRWVFDDWSDAYRWTITYGPRGTRLRPRTIRQMLDLLEPWCSELVDQVRVTKTPTILWPRGHKADLLYYD